MKAAHTAHAVPLPQTELAVREQNGASVRLLWARGTDILSVCVVDDLNGDAFEFVLTADERPLDAFYHPYAFAAARGLEFGSARPRRARAEYVDV
jgi:hypothetical protein